MITITMTITECPGGAVKIDADCNPGSDSTPKEREHAGSLGQVLHVWMNEIGKRHDWASPTVLTTGPNAKQVGDQLQEGAMNDFRKWRENGGGK